ncbi:MAG: ABC transporter substrate-binding protein [Fibrobacter sp.]|nr:ABC transporter substrate-binding protein [Fibrobacter sp.]
MKFTQSLFWFATFLVLCVALVACEEKSEEKVEKSAFKFGSVEIPVSDGTLCIAPFFVAKEKGFFAKEGVDVKFVSANAETRKIGLNNGTYPITNSDFAFFQSVENGVNIKVVEGFHIGCIHLLVKKGSPIRSAQGLKGKKIAVNAIGATPHQAATLWLEANGVSAINDVQFLPYADGNLALEALERGQVEAVSLWDPLGSLAAVDGRADVLMDLATDPVFAGRYCCFYYVSGVLLEKEPEKIKALLRALEQAHTWISAHPEETVELMQAGKHSAIEDKEFATALIKSYEYQSPEQKIQSGRNLKGDLYYFADLLHKVGYLQLNAEEFTEKIYREVNWNK